MNHTAEDIAIRCLRKHFYLNLFVLTALFLLTLFDIIELKTPIAINTMVEMYLILFIIISIPIVLKGFADKIKKLPKNIDRESAIYAYKKSSFVRLYFLSIMTLVSCMIYAFSQNKNFMYITVILLVALLFCKPSYPELIAITESENVSETPEVSEISVNDVDQVDNNK
ncbi:MAG: hypothetical protein WCR12_02280 [Dysgonamonadaceae bacterium]